MRRITKHPVLNTDAENRKIVEFTFDGKALKGFESEMISSALYANGITIFGHHKKDGAPQGLFCANGQCSQCTLLADGKAVKSCVTPLRAGIVLQSLKSEGALNDIHPEIKLGTVKEIDTEVLIIGGGPSGLSAAAELGKYNVKTLLIDDKKDFGGKLVLQTHKFFGSIQDCNAGMRGVDIAVKLQNAVQDFKTVTLWSSATCLYVFSDKRVGIIKDNVYCLVKPKIVICATGAREKFLPFTGNTLPGVYGAGAFQTLVNRDLVKASDKVFIVGGGNVGLITAYHAMQAGIEVVGLIEALPRCGGYKVHEDKIKRLGVPVYTSHTVLSANGKEKLESVTISEVDNKFKPIAGTEKTFKADALLIAVGLTSVNEFYDQAKAANIECFACGDAGEIAEASAALFSGKITAANVLKSLRLTDGNIPQDWIDKLNTLKSRPGLTVERKSASHEGKIYPILHCYQEIPCNPCSGVCPNKAIGMKEGNIMNTPDFAGKCLGCYRCLLVCPGLAITLVDKRKDEQNPTVAIPYEMSAEKAAKGAKIIITDETGNALCETAVDEIKYFESQKTSIVFVKIPADKAERATGIKLFKETENYSENYDFAKADDDAIVCRCERVSLGTIRKAIRSGITDLNQLKAVTRAGMGACGSKTCSGLLMSIYRSEGISADKITGFTKRPLFVEVPLGVFSNSEF